MILTPCNNRLILEPCTLPELNYQIDPYIGCGHYCYYCYVLSQALTDWRQEILFHNDITGRLEKEIAAIPPQTIYMGWHTDPYQPCEAECRQTRQILELLLEKGFSASILTKSDLVLRDLDLLQAMKNASVSISVAFNDNDVRCLFEANTIDTEKRISGLAQLQSEGIKTAALLCPVIPYVSDVMPLIEMLSEYTDKLWIYGLSINSSSDQNWQYVDQILENHFPAIKSRISSAVFSHNHAYWEKLKNELSGQQKKIKTELSIHI
jgi:DNA repair photolyase